MTRVEDVPVILSGGVGYRLVRRALGVQAFGVNAFTADAGAQLIEEHDEVSVNAGRHEELYVIISGRARFTIDGAELEAGPGTLVFVPDPTSHRSAVAIEDGTSALVVGGRAGEPYEVSAWETCFEALAGRREAALEHLRAAAELAPDEVRGWAAADGDLDSLRDDPGFPG